MLKDGAYIRKRRLEQISKEIARQLGEKKTPKYKGVITWIQVEIGLSEKKAKEYLDLVLSSHNWEIVTDFNTKIIVISEEESS